MPHLVADVHKGCSALNELTPEGMAHVVKPDLSETSFLEARLESPSDNVAVKRLPLAILKNQLIPKARASLKRYKVF